MTTSRQAGFARSSTGLIRTIGHVSLFEGCSPSELLRIAALAEEVSVAAGQLLLQDGQSGSQTFVIAQGVAEVAIGGRRQALLGPGDFFGETSVVDLLRRQGVTVTAFTPMRLLALDGRAFSGLLELAPVARNVITTLTERLREVEGEVFPRHEMASVAGDVSQ